MNVSISLDLGPARSRLRASLDPRDADRVIVRFSPTPGRRLLGLGLGCWATLGALGGLRGDGGVLATVVPFAVLAAVIAFGSIDLVLDRRRSRIESVWRIVAPVARFEKARGPFSGVVIARAEDVREKDDATVRETRYPVVVEAKGAATALRAFPTWEAAVDFGELVARFLRVDFRDDVEGRSVPHDRLDEPLAASEEEDPAKPARRAPSVAAWTGTDELVLDIPRPGMPTARPLLGLMAILVIVWMPLALLAGDIFGGIAPLVALGGAALKIGWGYGSRVVASPRGLVVQSFGLLGRRRHEIPIAEIESILLLQPEWGGPRGVLAEFFPGVVVARSDRVSVRFGHGLGRRDLFWIVEHLRRLFMRVGRGQPLKVPPPEPLRLPDPVLPVIGAGLLCGLAGAWAGPPASFCLNLPLLSIVLNVAGVSGALIAWRWTRANPTLAAGPAAARWRGPIALALGLWIGLDLRPEWTSATPDPDVARFWTAVTEAPRLEHPDEWLQGLTIPQAATLHLGGLAIMLLSAWVLGVFLIPPGVRIIRRFRKSAGVEPLPLRSPREGPAPSRSDSRRDPGRESAAVLAASLLIMWSAAALPDFYRPLATRRAEAEARLHAQRVALWRERQSRELASRTLLRLETPPSAAPFLGRPTLLFFANYLGREAALIDHLMWLRRAYSHADLRVIGIPADVQGEALAGLLEKRRWFGEHATDLIEGGRYRIWAGFGGPGTFALLIEANGTIRDRLSLPYQAEKRLAEWLGRNAAPRPSRVGVPFELRWTYGGHPVDLPESGRLTVTATDGWNDSHMSWISRQGSLPRTSVALVAPPGPWNVSLHALRLEGGEWSTAYTGYGRVIVPRPDDPDRMLNIPVQAPLKLVMPQAPAGGFPDWPAYAAGAPVVIAWEPILEADRFELWVGSADAEPSARKHFELPRSQNTYTIEGLGPGSYEVLVAARRLDAILGSLETPLARGRTAGFRFRIEP